MSDVQVFMERKRVDTKASPKPSRKCSIHLGSNPKLTGYTWIYITWDSAVEFFSDHFCVPVEAPQHLCHGTSKMKSWRCWIYAECFQTTEDELFDSNLYKSSSKFSWQPANFLSHFDEWHELSSQLLCYLMVASPSLDMLRNWGDGHRMPQVTTIHCEDLPSCKVVKDFDFPTPSQTKEIGLNLEGSRRTPRRSTSTCCHSIWIENGLPMGYVEYLPADCDNVFHSNGNWLGIFGQSMTKLYQILILSECVWRYLDSEWFW
jgi:hypothetical protein